MAWLGRTRSSTFFGETQSPFLGPPALWRGTSRRLLARGIYGAEPFHLASKLPLTGRERLLVMRTYRAGCDRSRRLLSSSRRICGRDFLCFAPGGFWLVYLPNMGLQQAQAQFEPYQTVVTVSSDVTGDAHGVGMYLPEVFGAIPPSFSTASIFVSRP